MAETYPPAQRALQDRFGTRRLADLQADVLVHAVLTDEDRVFIESRDMLFLTTVDMTGQPTVSYKGGAAGFARVVDDEIVMPCFDGNGIFLSMGNVAAGAGGAKVGLLFIDFVTPRRLRVHGTARLEEAEPPIPGAALVLIIRPHEIFINCGRYIHRYDRVGTSRHVPDAAGQAPVAEWKRLAFIQDDLPPADRAAVAALGTISQEAYDAAVARGEN